MNHKLGFVFVLFIASLLAACAGGGLGGPTPTPTPDPLPNADLERGREIFETGAGVLDHGCVECHTLDGTLIPHPTNPDYYIAPTLQGISVVAAERAPELSAVEYIRQSVTDPEAVLAEGYYSPMTRTPGLLLSDEDLDNVIAYILANSE